MEINIIPKFLDEAVTPLAQRAGNTLSSIWTIAFGGIDIYAEKAQLKRVHALNQFKQELEQAVSSIPEENIVEPPLHIVGPSLEASKYYFENDELRTMFAKLIAASINKETISNAHPSFVEIIKQLSPLDAINLKLFKDNNRHPIVNYVFVTDSGGTMPHKLNTFFGSDANTDTDLNAASISNLDRLGLVSISYEHHLTDDARYTPHENTLEYRALKEHFKLRTQNAPVCDIDIQKGIVDVTPFGENFIKLCI
ncbi:DUF4393 domain-containing protein [Bacillus toyonensis]|uniref:DUF4393 domain-containing protein n=1 Tax=Bacillus toyonensis TaxID=155322 RepID=A0AB36SQ74_9BACI|nr:DUF4393 domain-containing protein [Bacillus toyonensis]MCU4969270.1 DUF4393 domain-containing protein [Bacillus toyonensis]PEJ86588.1 DUF4393 domain-containing protein [Bacillus toyonensis]PEN55163.1 DUF4393 domain-containing protein [Bacillus toyonensis]PGE73482.1 DUF4393 domain-containing protein [Bacillus toyonensis]SLK20624.1 protein of unknown function [Bacillus toyonensis]